MKYLPSSLSPWFQSSRVEMSIFQHVLFAFGCPTKQEFSPPKCTIHALISMETPPENDGILKWGPDNCSEPFALRHYKAIYLVPKASKINVIEEERRKKLCIHTPYDCLSLIFIWVKVTKKANRMQPLFPKLVIMIIRWSYVCVFLCNLYKAGQVDLYLSLRLGQA